VNELKPAFKKLPSNVLPQQVLADAGYDSEPNHAFLRETGEVESVIPPLIGGGKPRG